MSFFRVRRGLGQREFLDEADFAGAAADQPAGTQARHEPIHRKPSAK